MQSGAKRSSSFMMFNKWDTALLAGKNMKWVKWLWAVDSTLTSFFIVWFKYLIRKHLSPDQEAEPACSLHWRGRFNLRGGSCFNSTVRPTPIWEKLSRSAFRSVWNYQSCGGRNRFSDCSGARCSGNSSESWGSFVPPGNSQALMSACLYTSWHVC